MLVSTSRVCLQPSKANKRVFTSPMRAGICSTRTDRVSRRNWNISCQRCLRRGRWCPSMTTWSSTKTCPLRCSSPLWMFSMNNCHAVRMYSDSRKFSVQETKWAYQLAVLVVLLIAKVLLHQPGPLHLRQWSRVYRSLRRTHLDCNNRHSHQWLQPLHQREKDTLILKRSEVSRCLRMGLLLATVSLTVMSITLRSRSTPKH